MRRRPPRSTLFPSPAPSPSPADAGGARADVGPHRPLVGGHGRQFGARVFGDRKSTRLNSSHVRISYAVFCLKKNVDHGGGIQPLALESEVVFAAGTEIARSY